jgi:hexosaminidase
MKKTLLLLFISVSLFAQHNIIPTPVSFEAKQGSFAFNQAKTTISLASNANSINDILVFFANDLQLKTAIKPVSNAIVLGLNQQENATLGKEGYELEVSAKGVKITANQAAGLFYGMQTLKQLIPVGSKTVSIPACKITDYPRFGWRGLMLDVSRHFFTKDEVKNFIDMMAQYKLNTLHWHLTDDNGWRIEIKSLPKLTSIGAWRVERIGHYGNREDPKPGEPATYGGFYTQEEIKEVVRYASARSITIVPEIDVPGHSMAALAAYPELSTRKEPKFVNPGTAFSEWYGNGKFKMLVENTLNPSDEKVYEFLDKVFTEVAALFPNKYIHMGGDESYHGYWEEDAGCKEFMAKNNLKDTHELQSYFVKRVEKIVNSKGKTLLGWDEILEGGLAPNATVMSWRGLAGGIEAAKQKHEVVMSPTTFAYIDYTQGDPTVELPIYASLSLRKTYEFEPVPDGVESKYILGGQGNLWSEQTQNYRHATYMAFPRAFAIAETVWSPKTAKNYPDFVKRTETHFDRFDAQKVKISRAILDPIVTTKKDGENLTCTITSDIADAEIYYTLDDSFPDNYSKKYTGAINIPKGEVKLQTIHYRNGMPIGRLLQIKREELVKRAK